MPQGLSAEAPQHQFPSQLDIVSSEHKDSPRSEF